MNSVIKKIFFAFLDFAAAILSVFLTLVFSTDLKYVVKDINVSALVFVVYPVAVVGFAYVLTVYNILWQYADLPCYGRLFFTSFFSSALLYIAHSAIFGTDDPNPIRLGNCICIMLIDIAFMATIRFIVYSTHKSSGPVDNNAIRGNVMIIGAGAAGTMLLNDIHKNFKKTQCSVKCFIDDDKNKIGLNLLGVKVVGASEDILENVQKYDINYIIFAIPTCSANRKSVILSICQKTGCKVMVLPSYYQIIDDTATIETSSLRNVEIEDLLGREPIDIKVDSVLNYVCGKTVLVTGGGGSIGSELCRQIACHQPSQLIIFDIYENNAYDIQNELIRTCPDLNLTVLIGSVRDEKRLNAIFEKYRPELVFHAAAHKHVPLMEDSPNESIKNNVFGTYNVAACSDKYGVKRFVLISTDKAVNPTNIMGASKRICEMVVQYFNSRSDTEFVAVRFGNVLGSNGSVIPLFKKQIEEGGPVTVTDANIIRYFMTIPEAVSLVLQAGATANGGEIFVLDMGEPVKILDLAENLIKLSGYKPYIDIKIEFTGLRPGEKMYEEKLLAEEGLKKTANSLIHIGKPIKFDEEVFEKTLKKLKTQMADDNADIRALVKSIVPTYSYSEN